LNCSGFGLQHAQKSSIGAKQLRTHLDTQWRRNRVEQNQNAHPVGWMGVRELLPQAKLLDELPILVGIRTLEVVQQLAALADHLEQSAAGVMVFDVRFEVVCQPIDASRKQRNLNFRRTGITSYALMLGNDLRFLRNGYWHADLSSCERATF